MTAHHANAYRRVELTLDEATALALLEANKARASSESIKTSALAWLAEVARLANTVSHADAEIADVAGRAAKTVRVYNADKPLTYNVLSRLLQVSVLEAQRRDACEAFSDDWREHVDAKRMADQAWGMLWRQWTEYGD